MKRRKSRPRKTGVLVQPQAVSTLRLDTCGDFLDARQYCAWRGEALRTVRRQIRAGTAFVMPREEKPRLKWLRSDCERAMGQASIITQRKRMAQAKLQRQPMPRSA